MAYERNKDQIENKWGEEFRNWPVEMQFFRHCRNASFHGNCFNIKDGKKTPAINPYTPPNWKHLVIADKSVHGSRFAGSFFEYQLVLPFLADIGEMLI